MSPIFKLRTFAATAASLAVLTGAMLSQAAPAAARPMSQCGYAWANYDKYVGTAYEDNAIDMVFAMCT